MIIAAQFLFCMFFAFVPVWAGGQAMRCHNEGHTIRSAACVMVGTALNCALFWLAISAVQNGWSLVTLLRFVTI